MAVSHHQGVPVFVSCLSVAFQMSLDLGLEGEREHPLGTSPADLIQRERQLLRSRIHNFCSYLDVDLAAVMDRYARGLPKCGASPCACDF